MFAKNHVLVTEGPTTVLPLWDPRPKVVKFGIKKLIKKYLEIKKVKLEKKKTVST